MGAHNSRSALCAQFILNLFSEIEREGEKN